MAEAVKGLEGFGAGLAYVGEISGNDDEVMNRPTTMTEVRGSEIC